MLDEDKKDSIKIMLENGMTADIIKSMPQFSHISMDVLLYVK